MPLRRYTNAVVGSPGVVIRALYNMFLNVIIYINRKENKIKKNLICLLMQIARSSTKLSMERDHATKSRRPLLALRFVVL